MGSSQWSTNSYNSGEKESLAYGFGVGCDLSNTAGLQLDYDKSKIDEVTDRAVSLNFITDLWTVE